MVDNSKVRGLRNNNPLNIRKGNNWQGERPNQTDKQFEEFTSMIYGWRAGLKILRNYIEGRAVKGVQLNTIHKIITRWAPANENNTQAYINTVCKRTGIHPFEVIRWKDRRKVVAIAQAMGYVECGKNLDESLIESAYDLLA